MRTNPQLELAFSFLENTGVNIFLTGKAGTGKTTFLRNLKIRSPKRMIVVAPTGVAAINAGGVTVHSFFQLPFGPYVAGESSSEKSGTVKHANKYSREKINIIRSIDLLVIDEISMVRADLLDAVNDVLCRFRDRNKPFGGVQLLLIGDLQQLAPVVKEDEWELLKPYYDSPFFFSSMALRRAAYISIELTEIFRQSDELFIHLLNKVRDNRADEITLKELNKRYIPDFDSSDKPGYITLTTHNYQAQQLNKFRLDKIEAPPYTYKAEIKGEFPPYSFPTDEELILKKEAQVMFVKNDTSSEKRYYNGKIGIITEIGPEKITVSCDDGGIIAVTREEWTNTKYTLDPETKEIMEGVEGTFRQYPLKTAWAITIHKSQGLTFERAIVDAGAAFTHGQVYVALSRCKTLEGLILSSPLRKSAVISDKAVLRFIQDIEKNCPGPQELELAERDYFIELLAELFDFHAILKELQNITSLLNEHLKLLFPELTERYRVSREFCHTELMEVGERFKLQLRRLVLEHESYERDPAVQERIIKGVSYFKSKVEQSLCVLLGEPRPDIDNKDIRKMIDETRKRLQQNVEIKLRTLDVAAEGFDVKNYLQAKAKAVVESPSEKTAKTMEKIDIPADILHPQLYDTLRIWRKAEAERIKLPVYTIMQQKSLLGVTNTLPSSSKELLKIPGIGKKILEKYGRRLLELVDEYRLGIKQE